MACTVQRAGSSRQALRRSGRAALSTSAEVATEQPQQPQAKQQKQKQQKQQQQKQGGGKKAEAKAITPKSEDFSR